MPSIHYLDRKNEIEDLVALNWDHDYMLQYLTETAPPELQLPIEKAKKTLLQIYKLTVSCGHSLCRMNDDNTIRSMLLVLPPYLSQTQNYDTWFSVFTKTISPPPAIIKKLDKIDCDKDTFRIFKFIAISHKNIEDEQHLINQMKLNASISCCRCFDARYDKFLDTIHVQRPTSPVFLKISNIRSVKTITDSLISSFIMTPIIAQYFEKSKITVQEIIDIRNFMSFNLSCVLIESNDLFLCSIIPTSFDNGAIVAHTKKAAVEFLTKYATSLSKNSKVQKEAINMIIASINRYKEAISITHSESFILFASVADHNDKLGESMSLFLSKLIEEFDSMCISPSLVVPDLRPVLQIFNKTLHSDAVDEILAKNRYKRVPCERNHEVYYKLKA